MRDFECRRLGFTKYQVVRAQSKRHALIQYSGTRKLRRLGSYDRKGQMHSEVKRGWTRFVTTDGTRRRLLVREAQCRPYADDDPRRLDA